MPSDSAVHAKAVELGKLVLRMTTKAGSGHPSSALALAHIIVELMYRRMRYDLADPWNPSNDRLVLSVGHAVPIVYAAYADLGGTVGRSARDAKRLTPDMLDSLREQESVLDGHPSPAEGFPFFDAATGSLGQGLSVAAGLAWSARAGGIDRRIYVILGDGESREGQVWEAADFIAEQKLTNVCAIFSCNGHGQAGPVSAQQSAAMVSRKLEAFGWQPVLVDGHNPHDLSAAIDQCGHGDRPLALVANTVKGWGVDLMQGQNYHGKPVSQTDLSRALDELDRTGTKLGAAASSWPRPPKPTSNQGLEFGFINPMPPFPEAMLGCGFDKALAARRFSTRAAYGVALTALGDVDPRVIALDADVSNSTFSSLFAGRHPDRFIECKIAEQNMVSVAAGLAAAGRIPFASTFAKFLVRATDQIDLAVISRANIKLVGSHAGVSLAADGPSQMAASDLAYFRSLTRVENGCGGAACHVFHPSDAVCAYRCCELMANVDGLCFLRTHRPDAPFLYSTDERFELCGCKQIRQGAHLTLVGSGFVVHTVLDAADELARQGISCNVFDAYTFPLNARPILDAARAASGTILCVEDNYGGGLHSELAEASAQSGGIRVIGLTAARIPKSAKTPEELFTYVGVGREQIVRRARVELAVSGAS